MMITLFLWIIVHNYHYYHYDCLVFWGWMEVAHCHYYIQKKKKYKKLCVNEKKNATIMILENIAINSTNIFSIFYGIHCIIALYL